MNIFSILRAPAAIGRRTLAICHITGIILLTCILAANGQSLPQSFSLVTVTAGLRNPTTMATTADGRIWIAEQGGTLRIVKNSTLLPTPFVSLSVDASGERGLIGLAVDPAFPVNGYVYLYYTVPAANGMAPHNRVSRFTAAGDVAVAGSETVLLDLDPLSSATNHNGGAMAFGPDGKLYIGVGENANAPNAQSLTNHLGKVLRINADGSIPADNPFATGSDARRRIWAYGLRNPYTLTFQPGSGRLLVNDVGQDSWEEINDATTGGQNFGWPLAEGSTSTSGLANPVFAYPHGSGDGKGCAITGGAFYDPDNGTYPATMTGKYFYQDLCNNWINYIDLSAGAAVRSAFATGMPASGLGLTLGTDGVLYSLSRGSGGSSGMLYKIIHLIPDVPEAFRMVAPVYNCQTGAIQFKTTGGNGTPVEYQAVGVTGWTTNPNQFIEAGLRADPKPMMLWARQNNVLVNYMFNLQGACNGTNQPPAFVGPFANVSLLSGQPYSMTILSSAFADPEGELLVYSSFGLPPGLSLTGNIISGSTTQLGDFPITIQATDPWGLAASGQFTLTVQQTIPMEPLRLTAPVYNCSTGSLVFQTSGGNGSPVEFFAIGVTPWTLNPMQYVEAGLRADPKPITLYARQGGRETTFLFNLQAACGQARTATPETARPFTARLYPNPVGPAVVVGIEGAQGQRIRLQLTDLSGKPIAEKQLDVTEADQRTGMDIQRQPSGMYLLRISNGRQAETLRVLKQE